MGSDLFSQLFWVFWAVAWLVAIYVTARRKSDDAPAKRFQTAAANTIILRATAPMTPQQLDAYLNSVAPWLKSSGLKMVILPKEFELCGLLQLKDKRGNSNSCGNDPAPLSQPKTNEDSGGGS